MQTVAFNAGEWFLLVHHELLLFTAAFFAIGVIDEFAIDIVYIWQRIAGRIRTPEATDEDLATHNLAGMAAIFIPA